MRTPAESLTALTSAEKRLYALPFLYRGEPVFFWPYCGLVQYPCPSATGPAHTQRNEKYDSRLDYINYRFLGVFASTRRMLSSVTFERMIRTQSR